MSDLEKLKFPALNVAGTNYIVWALEASNYLGADGLAHTIDPAFILPSGTGAAALATRRDAARAVCLILRHLPKDLKFNYLEEQNPTKIWNSLKLRFDTDRKQAMLPLLNDEWNKLCFYNFKSVTEYTTKLYGVASELSWCDRKISEAEKIEKTLTTFHPSERILAMQYRRMNHDTFDKLVAVLLLDEKHGLLLQRNHDERRIPAADQSKQVPEVNYGEANRRVHTNEPKGKGKQQWRQQRGGRRNKCRKCGLFGHWQEHARHLHSIASCTSSRSKTRVPIARRAKQGRLRPARRQPS